MFASMSGSVAFDTLATKADLSADNGSLRSEIGRFRTELKVEIAELRTELKAEIVAVRTELKTEIASLRSDVEFAKRDLKIWFGSIMVVAVGVILAAIRYLPVGHP
jgi:hypothetical protein